MKERYFNSLQQSFEYFLAIFLGTRLFNILRCTIIYIFSSEFDRISFSGFACIPCWAIDVS